MRATELLFESRAAVLKAEAETKLLEKQIELERLRLDAKAIRSAAFEEAAAIVEQAAMAYADPVWAQEIITDIRDRKEKT
jgi:hypothetical protein